MCLPSDFLPGLHDEAAASSIGTASAMPVLARPSTTGGGPDGRQAAPGTLGRRRRPEEIERHNFLVRTLHAEGLTDAAIAARLGVPVHAAAYLRRKQGLAAHSNPGDRSAVIYAPDEVALIVRLREERCLSWTAIMRAVGRGSPSSVEGVYDRMVQGVGRVTTARDRTRTRTCLACRKPFRSEWAGNRRCEPCSELLRGAAAGAGVCTLATRSSLGEGGAWRQAVRGQS